MGRKVGQSKGTEIDMMSCPLPEAIFFAWSPSHTAMNAVRGSELQADLRQQGVHLVN